MKIPSIEKKAMLKRATIARFELKRIDPGVKRDKAQPTTGGVTTTIFAPG